MQVRIASLCPTTGHDNSVTDLHRCNKRFLRFLFRSRFFTFFGVF